MNNFNLNLFKYFYYVVYYNGFTNASKNLNIAQSSLSYNIKQLELQLDKTLIIRDNKNFELTEDGYNLYENLKSAFSILNQNLEQFDNQNTVELTIGVRHYLSDFIFKDSIIEFINTYPNIHINIKLYSKLDVKKFEEEYDVLIDYEDYTNLINTNNKDFLCTLNNIFVSGKELSKNYESIQSIKELGNTRLISMCPNKRNGKFQKSTLREVAGKNGVANQSYAAYTQQVVENTLQYFDQWGAHSFQAMIGQSYQTELNQAFSMQNTDFPLDELLYNNMGLGQSLKNPVGDNLQMSSSKYKDKLASFFARVMYNYDQRYFLSASVRFEGSSKFGKEASKTLGRWGVFPSISASWNIAGEDFMAQYDNLDDMKLRFGYGVTGNMPGSSYLYLMTVGAGGDYIFSNGQFIQPWGPTSNVNPTIRWEEKHEFNLGYDFATFKNRFTGSLDLYFRNTTDLLYEYDVPMPPYPYGKRWDNYGQIYNYGVELQLNGTPIRTKNWNWDISLNAAWNNNKVVRITGEQYGTEGVESYVNTGYISSGDGETGSYTMRLAEGQPIGNFYGYKFYTIDENGDWI